MKKIIFVLLVLTARAEFNSEAFLEALAMKETGIGWNGEPGLYGELSKWQIMPVVWRQEMGAEPFVEARNGKRARVCTLKHLARLRQRTGDNVERLATCWHFGASHAGKSSVWGQEVANVYEDLCR